ncbi:hypothetical protein [Streptomyces sp. ID05-47C]|uniref:hypothetical protein n=1 Tax=Streptomyces sp. ID05-47C TaxID=3028665 RepID=UPI0029BA146E|nr:hypothetical protein [Streptomyces sp. ID05-47C]MDX3574046.1 hypothetical protein [Streptomyces sp. ID05-47C]
MRRATDAVRAGAEAVRHGGTACSPGTAEQPTAACPSSTSGHSAGKGTQRLIAGWAPLPRLTPLLELTSQDPVRLVAYIDRTGADFERRGAAGPQDAG